MKPETITSIVKASGVQPGELILVHFWGEDADKSIANDFMTAVASLGASPLLLQQSRRINRNLFAAAGETCFDENYFRLFSHFDAVLDVFAQQPIIPGYAYEPEPLRLYQRTVANLFSALMKAKRFTQIRVPTRANAEESALEPEEYIRRMEAAYEIDYDALLIACKQARQRYAAHDRLALKTGEDCCLHFDLSGREWHIDAGDGDWPCGEIYIAPQEDHTHGSVYFEKLYWEDEGCFEQVTLHAEAGKLTGSSHPAVHRLIQSLSEENRVICELGLGMNPNIASLCGYTVLDEKKKDTFHIAIGSNHMFGGANHTNMHMDLTGGAFTLAADE